METFGLKIRRGSARGRIHIYGEIHAKKVQSKMEIIQKPGPRKEA